MVTLSTITMLAVLTASHVALVSALLLLATQHWHGHRSMDINIGVQKFHIHPTTRVGGVAVVVGVWAGSYLATSESQALLWPLLLAGLPAFVFGLVEDVTKQVSVRARLLATMACGVLGWWITGHSIPYIYDFDDAFFLKYSLDRFKKVSFLLRDKFNPIVKNAAAVTAGNNYLATYARQWNAATHVLPTVVDTTRYTPVPARQNGVLTVGWIGSPSTSVYLSELAKPLAELGREGPVRFLVVGGYSAAIPGVEVVNMPWSEATEVDMINTFDIGVMPLFDDEWAKGKCAFKLIQYMACGVPVVASPVGANVEVVTNECGLLAGSAVEWLAGLRTLRDSPALRQRLGDAGRERVVANYSLHTAVPKLAEVIRHAAAKG